MQLRLGDYCRRSSKIWTDPTISASVKMTQFNAGGTSTNIIPGKATFSIDARAQTNEVMQVITEGWSV